MPGWPDGLVTPEKVLISTGSRDFGAGFYAGVSSAGTATAAVWPSANLAIWTPFYVEAPFTAYQMAIDVSVQSGNCDIGIYNEKGKRLVSMGSTAVGAAGIQKFNITDTLLNPGTYFAALCIDNTTASIFRMNLVSAANCRVFANCQQQAVGAVTLPDPAVFAAMTQVSVPLIAIAGQAVI